MLAVDTNIILRILVDDDPHQTAVAEKLMRTEQVFIPASVMLEAEWVLRSFYRFDRAKIASGLRSFAGLRNVTLQSRVEVVRALGWFSQGMDFGDALHVSLAEPSTAFVTFDRALIERAKTLSRTPVRLP